MSALFSVRKAYMTLLETLIAVSILSILLVFVFGFFRELSEMTRLSEQAQRDSFKMRYLESRLGFIFERIVNENESKKRPFYFYTQPSHRDFSNSPSLIFTFDNEVRKNPHFSRDLLARLYVDLNGRLCLASWPLHVDQPHEYLYEEVLCEHVVNIKYFFYAAPERVQGNNDIQTPAGKGDSDKKTPEKDKWHQDEWALTYDQMPVIIKLVIQVAKDAKQLEDAQRGMRVETNDLSFNFVLPSSKNIVYYPVLPE